MRRGTARRHAVVALMLSLALTVPAGTQARGETRTYRVCRDTLSLRHAPAGVTIGFLHRGARAIVTLYARRHRWAYVLSAEGHGWVLTSGLCRRSR